MFQSQPQRDPSWQLASATIHVSEKAFRFQPPACQLPQLMPSRAETNCPSLALPRMHICEQKSQSLGADCYIKDNQNSHFLNRVLLSHPIQTTILLVFFISLPFRFLHSSIYRYLICLFIFSYLSSISKKFPL